MKTTRLRNVLMQYHVAQMLSNSVMEFGFIAVVVETDNDSETTEQHQATLEANGLTSSPKKDEM